MATHIMHIVSSPTPPARARSARCARHLLYTLTLRVYLCDSATRAALRGQLCERKAAAAIAAAVVATVATVATPLLPSPARGRSKRPPPSSPSLRPFPLQVGSSRASWFCDRAVSSPIAAVLLPPRPQRCTRRLLGSCGIGSQRQAASVAAPTRPPAGRAELSAQSFCTLLGSAASRACYGHAGLLDGRLQRQLQAHHGPLVGSVASAARLLGLTAQHTPLRQSVRMCAVLSCRAYDLVSGCVCR